MQVRIPAPVASVCWQHCVSIGQTVMAGSDVVSLECFKMEFLVPTPVDGVVVWLLPMGSEVAEGADVAIIETT